MNGSTHKQFYVRLPNLFRVLNWKISPINIQTLCQLKTTLPISLLSRLDACFAFSTISVHIIITLCSRRFIFHGQDRASTKTKNRAGSADSLRLAQAHLDRRLDWSTLSCRHHHAIHLMDQLLIACCWGMVLVAYKKHWLNL